MIFVYKAWEQFCKKLQDGQMMSIPACEVTKDSGAYLVLKHDVETKVSNAYTIAQIEHKYGHRGSYYVQAYLLEEPENVCLLQQMQEMGHEISYHYDVMDSNKGNLQAALCEFEENRKRFEDKGFPIITVCQHGNPVVERVGYHSNRDFFRSETVKKEYPDIADIMVDFKTSVPTEYGYFSDAGRRFKRIFDPINNDIVKSDDQDIVLADLKELYDALDKTGGNIVSIHPHRWTESALQYCVKSAVFKTAKTVAKCLMVIPPVKKLMSRYYYLAKKL